MEKPVRGLRQPLSVAQREEIVRLRKAGVGVKATAEAMSCSKATVKRVWNEWHVGRGFRKVSPLRLSLAERETISRGLAVEASFRSIGRQLGRSASTVSREVGNNGGPDRYRAVRAEQRAIRCAKRPKRGKLTRCPQLRAEVEAGLEEQWSPQQISARLRRRFPHDPGMRISHETIYRSLYVQSRGELRRQLTVNLRTQRTRRRPRAGGDHRRRGQIAGMVSISQRPAEVADRAVPGHWEGDLIVGSANKSRIATLVERQTRYVLLARLEQFTSDYLVGALQAQIAQLPGHLKRSLTWDQGREMSAHAHFSVQTGVPVFFCDPHSPWQRGSNENTNGLLRQYLPKSTDLSIHTQSDLDQIAARLNGRPRQTLDWMTPAEKMNELLLR